MEVIKSTEGFESINSNPSLMRKVVHLDHLMVTIMEFLNGPMETPDHPHKHVHEQITYIASGSLKLFVEDREYLLNEGDVFKIASNLNHCIQTLSEYVKLVDSFTPLREDFI
ncbi:cupin domain-containing protein [Flavobacterium undicola]|uniref:cupin domain-containing protein n=1 Tax=Flavobacterium undicola TaxID=1932779 RepID=UPI0013769DE2|nr:cupin domain-containing protein [Flavobacterium undicola]MBA0884029.1 cupin domain-containing protein [Flavobacterium undicola]